MTSYFALTAALLLSSSLLATAATTAENRIVLGTSMQLTGANAVHGNYLIDGYRMAVDRINAEGGVEVNGETYELALKVYDNQSNIDLAVQQYVRLVSEDNVDFLLSPFASSFTVPTSTIAEKYQIPMIASAAASNQIFSRGFHYIFGTMPPATDNFHSTLSMLQQLEPAPESVALIYADDAYSLAVAKGTRKLLQSTGFDLVIDERFSAGTGDFSTLLARIDATQPDVVLVAAHETAEISFVRQAKSLGVSPKIYSFTVGVTGAAFREELGNAANYAFGITLWLPKPLPEDQWFGNGVKFAKDFVARYGYTPDYHAASAVATIEALVHAIEKAGTLNPQQVREALARVEFDCLYGHIDFSKNGQVQKGLSVVQILNGEVKPIFGGEGFVNQPVYPMPAWSER